MEKKNNVWAWVLAIIVIAVIIFFVVKAGKGGTGNNASSTATSTMAGWIDSTDTARGISFKYPANLGTKYINLIDWPPQVAVINGPLSCTEAGTATSTAGVTKQQTINGRVYCVTTETQGAAGSIYYQYAYASQMPDGRVAILTFTAQYPQCVNYPEPKQTECKNEEASFDINPTIDQIFSTLQLGTPTLNYQKG